MHGYENITVDEIRLMLKKDYGVTDEQTLKQKKLALVTLLQEKVAEKEAKETTESEVETNQVFEEVAEPEDSLNDTEEVIPIPEVVPEYGSEDWLEFIERQFAEYELDPNGNPKCMGCRRLVQKFVGAIYSDRVTDFNPPAKENDGTGTVVWEVGIIVTNQSHPLYGEELVMSDIADVNKYNTDPPYHKHPCATAATRAASRVYRKMLGLSRITAEENSEVQESSEEFVEDSFIEDGQIEVINMMCGPSRCDIDVIDFVNCGKEKYATIHAVPHAVAQRMIRLLSDIQQGKKQRPTNLSRYNPNWRET